MMFIRISEPRFIKSGHPETDSERLISRVFEKYINYLNYIIQKHLTL